MGDSYDGGDGGDSIESGSEQDSGYDSSAFDNVNDANESEDYEGKEGMSVESSVEDEPDEAINEYTSDYPSDVADINSNDVGDNGFYDEESDEVSGEITNDYTSNVNGDHLSDVDDSGWDELSENTKSDGDDESAYDTGDELERTDDKIEEAVEERAETTDIEEEKEVKETVVEEKDLESKESLTVEEKDELQKETNWSDSIVNAIDSVDEAQVYKDAGLKEAEIDGKVCLVREDIDLSLQDEYGRTNLDRMSEGLAPIREDGSKIELHHIGQKSDSPLAELTMQEHRGKGNDAILHDKTKESEIDRSVFDGERQAHWEARAKGLV